MTWISGGSIDSHVLSMDTVVHIWDLTRINLPTYLPTYLNRKQLSPKELKSDPYLLNWDDIVKFGFRKQHNHHPPQHICLLYATSQTKTLSLMQGQNNTNDDTSYPSTISPSTSSPSSQSLYIFGSGPGNVWRVDLKGSQRDEAPDATCWI